MDPVDLFHSPYVYVGNCPLNYTDPDGMVPSPIYDYDGNFLGTDDEGLQGDAIFMNASDFTQGMSHEDALRAGFTAHQLMALTFITSLDFTSTVLNAASHYVTLPNRPDYDGHLTLKEVIKWYNGGTGEPLFVDAGKIDLSPLTVGDFSDQKSRSINFFKGKYQNIKTGPVYGHIQVTMINSAYGLVKLGVYSEEYGGWIIDKYDFANPFFKGLADYLWRGNPKDFFIIGYKLDANIPMQK